MKIKTFLLYLLIITSCNNNWNSQFVNGKINKNSLQYLLGQNSEILLTYIKNNRIQKLNSKTNIGYTEKIFEKKLPFIIDKEILDNINYIIEIHGHKNILKYNSYFHPVLYFCFDKNDILIYIGEWQYP